MNASPSLYIIAGCNGAGKTTASYTVLPDILNCKEFVNADEIARGLSPFQPDRVSFQAGRLMLTRIKTLLAAQEDFALETTLATKSYVSLVKEAQQNGYQVNLLFFWLNSVALAIERVALRVQEGGHHIPEAVVRRRCEGGLRNFFGLYQSLVNSWMLADNSGQSYQIVARGNTNETTVLDNKSWSVLNNKYYE